MNGVTRSGTEWTQSFQTRLRSHLTSHAARLSCNYDCIAASRSLVSVVVAVIASGSILSLTDVFGRRNPTTPREVKSEYGPILLP